MRKILTVTIVAILALASHASVLSQPLATIALPEPGGTEQLYPGCNPIALTFPDGTASQTVVQAVSPAGAVQALWSFNAGSRRFEGFSPAAPQASDLLTVGYLDAVWICVAGEPPPPPTPTAPASAPTTYEGTHSGGGTVTFRVSADGGYVETFEAKGFCGDEGNGLWLSRIRIANLAFYWEQPFYDRYRVVSGTLQVPGEASGTISYHDYYGCHRDNLIWTASIQ